jgi:cytochrome c oxidase assembly factor CtaG
MMQHLLFMVIAPPLLLLGAPAIPLLRRLPRWILRHVLAPFLRSPVIQKLGRAITHPVFSWLGMAVAMLAWHVPAAYEWALKSSGWHEVEHACFLITSSLFWFSVIQPWPSRVHWPRWTMPLYLLLGDVVNTVLSAFLAFSDRVLYPSYANSQNAFGISALGDQAAAGAVMWTVGSFVFLGAAALLLLRLLSENQAAENAWRVEEVAQVPVPTFLKI